MKSNYVVGVTGWVALMVATGAVSVRTASAEPKSVEFAQGPTAPNTQTEPKRVRTVIIRTDQIGQRRIEAPVSGCQAEPLQTENQPEQKRVGSAQPGTTPNARTEPQRVRTVTVRIDKSAPTAWTAFTEPKHVRTTVIRPDEAEQKRPKWNPTPMVRAPTSDLFDLNIEAPTTATPQVNSPAQCLTQ
jgi:hypothetical protein